VRSLGDKHYKSPEYSAGFYKDGGLIAGSSNVNRKSNKPSQGNYGKKFKGPLFPGRLTWKEREAMETLKDEVESV